MTKSPGRIVTRAPSTVVYAPSPSMMKRRALGVWRCVGATSPGRISCSPAYSVVVMKVLPRSAGFSSMSTRRSASFAVISSPARAKCGPASCQRQIAGTAAVPGLRRIVRSQSGRMSSASSSRENAARSGLTTAAMGPRLVHLRAGDLHRLRVALVVPAQVGGVFLGRAADRLDVEVRQALDHLGHLYRL